MKKITRLFGLFIILLVAAACSKESYEPTPTGGNGGSEIQNATQFTKDVLENYYLWNKEIASAISSDLNPSTCTDPIATVKKIRYKQGGGYDSKQDEDRWTQLFDDVTPFLESVQGVETTNGMSLSVGAFNNTTPQEYFFIVNFVYDDSPAAKAGLKRGNLITTYNGNDITEANIDAAYYGETTATYGLAVQTGEGIADTGEEVTLTPVKMYLDPIISSKVFDVAGKKVGYLMYDSFDLDSAEKLINTFKDFKNQGVTELILDLRYNGGGYVLTENLLASLLAPADKVEQGALYQQEIYNSILTQAWSKDDEDFNKTFFTFNHEINKKKLSTKDANIGLNKIYAIVTGNTASASEAVLVGLSPYVNIVTIGQRSYGKYCTGYILGVDDVYEKAPASISKWGIYVMITTYADCDNKNLARPVGIDPDVEAKDNPMDGHLLGDENETMLKAALQTAGKSYTSVATTRALSSTPQMEIKMLHNKYKFGKRIKQLPTKIELEEQ
ncbi:MAG: hypothetical protein IJR07_09325 [Bacteroidaceae bacterium]|nr:hypothetical protein [Bacteroidaceae bacterium]